MQALLVRLVGAWLQKSVTLLLLVPFALLGLSTILPPTSSSAVLWFSYSHLSILGSHPTADLPLLLGLTLRSQPIAWYCTTSLDSGFSRRCAHSPRLGLLRGPSPAGYVFISVVIPIFSLIPFLVFPWGLLQRFLILSCQCFLCLGLCFLSLSLGFMAACVGFRGMMEVGVSFL